MGKIKILFFIIAFYSAIPSNLFDLKESTGLKITKLYHKNTDNQKNKPPKKIEPLSLLGFITAIVSIIGIASGTIGLWIIGSVIAAIFALISHFRLIKNKQFKGKIFNIFSWINFGIMTFLIVFIIFILMSINIQCNSF